tara:strand:- start:332 stop:2296 length:1965 start_codon:yes stop_codon:yes gene_type:complete
MHQQDSLNIKDMKNINLVIVLSGVIILYAFLSIYYLPPEDAVARVHDYLEGIFSVYKVRAELSGFFLDYDYNVQQIFNGVPLSLTGLSDFNVGANMYLFFDPFNAYVINQFLFRTIGFIGLLLLLKDHVLPKGSYYVLIAVSTALDFAVINHFPTRFGTILYQPLLYWSILNIYSGSRKLRDIMIIVAYPFMMGSIIRGGFVAIGIVIIVTFYCWVISHSNKKFFLITAIATVFTVLLVESRIFYQYLFADFHSARNESISTFVLNPFDLPNLSRVFYKFVAHFMHDGYGHHLQGQKPFIFWVVILGICVICYRWRLHLKDNVLHIKLAKRLIILFCLTVAISLIYGLVFYYPYLQKLVGIKFGFHRISALSPILWHVMFAISVALLIANYGSLTRKIIVPFILIIVFSYASQQQLYGLKQNINKALGIMENIPIKYSLKSYITGKPIEAYILRMSQEPPYVPLKDFFRTKTFANISRDISEITNRPKSSYRVMCFDLAPSVLQFNGFYTLDSQMADEPLEYAKEFAHLFRHEFAKDGISNMFMREVLYTYVANESRKDNGITPTFDVCQFVNMGGKFIFSSKPLLNASELHLSLLKSYRNLKPTAIGRDCYEIYDSIYLYQVNVPLECSINGTHTYLIKKTNHICGPLKTGSQ